MSSWVLYVLFGFVIIYGWRNFVVNAVCFQNPPYSGSNATSEGLTEPPPESPDIPISVSGSFNKSVDSLHVVEGGEGLSVADLPEMENIALAITKDYHGLGITIAGYVCERGLYSWFILSLMFGMLTIVLYRKIVWNTNFDLCYNFKLQNMKYSRRVPLNRILNFGVRKL